MAGKFGGGRKFKSQWTPSGDGTKHPSKGEAKWWDLMRLRERAGEISRLLQNPRWPMYVARDCPHCRDSAGVHHFADFKGGEGETALSKLKRKFVAARFGVDIELVGPVLKQAARAKAKRAAAKTAFAERGKS